MATQIGDFSISHQMEMDEKYGQPYPDLDEHSY